MSSLNDLIKQWKEGLSRGESFQADDLAELEQHLRNSITDLRSSGLSEEEAFLVASSRLGNAAALEHEFSKVNGGLVWRRRVLWMLAGYVSLLVFGKFVRGIGSVAAAGAAYAGAGGTMMASASLLVIVLCWACLLLWILGLGKHGESRFIRYVQKTPPSLLVTGLIGCLLAGTAISVFGPVVTIRLSTIEVYGEAAYVGAMGNLILQIVIPTICLAVVISQKTRMRPVTR